MQIKKANSKAFLIALFCLVHLFVPGTAVCQSGIDCQESFAAISRAYNEGSWTTAKNASLEFINSVGNKDIAFFSSAKSKKAEPCKNFVPQVYYYLIQSYLRLFNIDSAKIYYFEALQNEYKIDLEPGDEKILNQLGILKRHSVNFYVGIISADIKELKFGLSYGITSKWFIETAFNNRHFNHSSDIGDGVLGKAMIRDPNIFPYYSFRIQGYEQYVDLASFIRLPIFVSQKDVNIFYASIGGFMTYYLSSRVNTWNLLRYDSGTGPPSEVYKPFAKKQRYTRMDALGVDMDLKRLYNDNLNYGLFMNLGSSINLKNRWQLFFEIKFAVGKNNSYRYKPFSSYRPGVDYFFLVIGVTKKFYKFVEKKY